MAPRARAAEFKFRLLQQVVQIGLCNQRLESRPERRGKLQRQSQVRVAWRESDDVCRQVGLEPELVKESWKLTAGIEVAARSSEPLFDQLNQPPHRRSVGGKPPPPPAGGIHKQ